MQKWRHIHSWSGLISIVALLILTFTGMILLFKGELYALWPALKPALSFITRLHINIFMTSFGGFIWALFCIITMASCLAGVVLWLKYKQPFIRTSRWSATRLTRWQAIHYYSSMACLSWLMILCISAIMIVGYSVERQTYGERGWQAMETRYIPVGQSTLPLTKTEIEKVVQTQYPGHKIYASKEIKHDSITHLYRCDIAPDIDAKHYLRQPIYLIRADTGQIQMVTEQIPVSLYWWGIGFDLHLHNHDWWATRLGWVGYCLLVLMSAVSGWQLWRIRQRRFDSSRFFSRKAKLIDEAEIHTASGQSQKQLEVVVAPSYRRDVVVMGISNGLALVGLLWPLIHGFSEIEGSCCLLVGLGLALIYGWSITRVK